MCYRKGILYQLPLVTAMLCNTQALSGSLQSHSLWLMVQRIDWDMLLL